MNKENAGYYAGLTLVSAVVYTLLDLSVRMTGFLEFGVFIGIKNFLPAVLGLLFGWYGAVGCLVGSIFSSWVTAATFGELLFEAVCVLVFSLGIWIFWHVGAENHRIHLKKAGDYLKYFLLTGGLSAVCGAISLMMIPGDVFWTVCLAYFTLSLLVGIPLIILLTSTVCVLPVMPPKCSFKPDISGNISGESGSLDAFNERMEECAQRRNIGRKELFGIQNCIEEVMILVLENSANALVDIRLYYDDSASLWIEYGGKKYNPLVVEKKAESQDMFGLQLICHRALRASYRYRKGVNRIHIVI